MLNNQRVKMKTIEASVRKENFKPFLLGYSKEEAIEEASRCLHCLNPRCMNACPIHNRIPDFIKAIKDDDLALAYKILKEKTVMPEICGTVCPHENQCEGACVLKIKGESVAIGSLERYIAKSIREKGEKEEIKESNHKKVLCIGSGPASLSLALVLSRDGYDITILEKDDFIGGVLVWGIPSYRLESEAIDHIINILKDRGVKFILNQEIKSIDEYKKDYDAIFLGTGAPNSNSMRINGEDLKGIYHADDFLKKINLAPMDKDGRRAFEECGERVLVIGGGNVAMDAARDAIRLKQVKEVTIVYRRTEAEMPACKEELKQAKDEGIIFKTLTNPVEFVGKEGKVTKAICAKMELGEPDSSGRRRPVETNERIEIEVDTVVMALGFSNDKTISENSEGLEADKWGCFIVDDKMRTSVKGVYAAGDAVTGASTVVAAMKAAIIAAKAIEEDLV